MERVSYEQIAKSVSTFYENEQFSIRFGCSVKLDNSKNNLSRTFQSGNVKQHEFQNKLMLNTAKNDDFKLCIAVYQKNAQVYCYKWRQLLVYQRLQFILVCAVEEKVNITDMCTDIAIQPGLLVININIKQLFVMRTLGNNQHFFHTPTKSQTKFTKRLPMTPSAMNRTTIPNFGNRSPQFIKIVNQDLQLKEQLLRQKSHNILNYLDKRQPEVIHKYKKFENHSKSSDLSQVREIILELLNKHAIERKLTSSEQYILTGYFARYLEFAAQSPRLIRNPFNITNRIHTNNSPDMVTEPYIDTLSPRKSPSKNKIAPKFKNKSAIELKRDELEKQLEMIKFLWQVYMIKCITCPNLTKLSAAEEAQNRREMLDIVTKLKGIEQKRGKIGEEKALMELGKIMKRFQARISSCLA